MSDEVNKNPLPRVVKGTGFYTPMDIAPGESSVATPPPTSPSTIGEMSGLPTSMDTPPPASTPPATSAPAQNSEGNGNAEGK